MARGDRQFLETNFFLADSTVFDVLSMQLLRGDPATALTAPRSLVLAGLLALGITLITISYQSIRAARANPVESLRYE